MPEINTPQGECVFYPEWHGRLGKKLSAKKITELILTPLQTVRQVVYFFVSFLSLMWLNDYVPLISPREG